MVGEVPRVEEPGNVLVDLPRGVLLGGKRQTRIEVRELTGVDEEALGRLRRADETYDLLLARGVVRMGDVDLTSLPLPERQGYLRQLLTGERDALFLAIARVTYGDERKFPLTCDKCGVSQDLLVTLSKDFPLTAGDEEIRNEYEYITSRNLRLAYRLSTGFDQAAMLRKEGASLAEMNTLLLSNCIVSVNGDVVVDPTGFARDLPMRDRQGLLAEMSEKQPRVDLKASVSCIGCGEGQQVEFGWLDFFRP
jgi:hypothetical protein